MKKKLLALALAVLMACSLLASPALAAPSATAGRQIYCSVQPDGVEVTFYGGAAFSGQSVVQLATYSVQGRLLDFKSVLVDDLAQGYRGVIPAKTEPGGGFKVFLTGGETYQPLVENAKGRLPEDPKADPDCLLTVTKGAGFKTNSVKLWNERYPDDYIGVDHEVQFDERFNMCLYVNGEEMEYYRVPDARPGDVAKLYDRDHNGRVDEIRITQYHVAQVTSSVHTQTNASGVETVIVPGVTDGFIPVSQVAGDYASLKKGDVVLYYTSGQHSGDRITTLETPKSVTGKVTAVGEDGRLTLNSKTYEPTGIMGGSRCYADMLARWDDLENEYTFYLDKNGGICAYDSIIADNTAVVLESAWVPDATLKDGGYMQAKLLLASGDVVITPIDRVGVALDGGIVMCTPTRRPVTDPGNDRLVSYWTLTGDEEGDLSGSLSFASGFWSYRVNEMGHYEITNRNLKDQDFAPETVIAPHQSVVSKPQFAPGSYANNSTLFLVEQVNEDNTSIFTTYVGYNNVPAMDAEDMLGGVGIRRRDTTAGSLVEPFARYVYLKTKGFAEPTPAPVEPKPTPKDLPEGLTFRTDDQYAYNSNGNYIINVLDPKTGARTALEVDDLSYVSDDLEMYIVGPASDGVVTAMTQVTQSDAEKGLTKGAMRNIGAGVVYCEDGAETKGFQYGEDTVCVVIDLKPDSRVGKLVYSSSGMFDPEELDLDPNVYLPASELYVIADEDDFAHYIYVVRTLKAN